MPDEGLNEVRMDPNNVSALQAKIGAFTTPFAANVTLEAS